MIIYIQQATGEQIQRSEVKKLLAEPQVVGFDEDNNPKYKSRMVSSLESLSDEDFAAVGVERIDYIETPKPEIDPWEQATPGELDKSQAGEWRATWNITSPSLNEHKAAKWRAIKAERAQLESYEGLTLTDADGIEWQYDPYSKQLLDEALAYYQLTGFLPSYWLAVDNTPHPLTLERLTKMISAYSQYKQGIFYASQSARQYLESEECDTHAKIAAVKLEDFIEQ